MDSKVLKKRIGEFTILALYLLIDIIEIWPKSHLLSLVLAVGGLVALLLADGEFTATSILSFGGLASIVSLIILLIVAPILPEETETHGWLLAGHGDTPPNGCAPEAMQPNSLLFIAGTNGFWSNNKEMTKVLQIDGDDIISAQKTENGLFFNVNLYDRSGNLVVKVINNEFHIVSGQYLYRDRSEDRSRLTVFDRKGEEIFDVVYVNQNAVSIKGTFYSSDSARIYITDRSIAIPGSSVMMSTITRSCKGGFPPNRSGFVVSKGGGFQL